MTFFFFAICVFGVAFSGGFFQVPCISTIEKSKSGRKLGDLIAYLNLTTFIFVTIGTFLFWIITYFTNQNSELVFAVLWAICIITFYFFNNYFQRKKRTEI
jgi:acyl-[acyl-carrier-protein]-phospholipid O-acyltransferase/long-chain-fatty-acid--[acyl-carrier-protein] ligase